jgi:hypothetical protein
MVASSVDFVASDASPAGTTVLEGDSPLLKILKSKKLNEILSSG